MAGRRGGGGRWLEVHGVAVSLGRDCCSDGGAHRWLEVVLDGKAASASEGGGRLGASTDSCGGRWLRGARERCAVVNTSALGAEEHNDEGAEADDERVEWVGVRRLSREEERMTSLSDRQRDEVTYGAAAACVARGVDVAAGRQRRHEVATVATQLSHACDASVRAPFKRRLKLTSGPRHFLFIKFFKHLHFDIRIGDLSDV
jgi:hypothetical protein